MRRLGSIGAALVVALVCCIRIATAAPDPSSGDFLLAPPRQTGPVVVRAHFEFHDILEIDDREEAFEFFGVLTLTWKDPRQSFDPAVAGVDEKDFQGNSQLDEVATGWHPQVVLANESGSYETSGVALRVQPDGTSTLIQMITAAAQAELNMRRYPFDKHHLEAIFEVLGFDQEEVVMVVDSSRADSLLGGDIRTPHWRITRSGKEIRNRPASYAGHRGVASVFIASVDVERKPFFIIRLVVLPLIVIVLLSFSVFWMDRSSLGDRINVSFIGILTGVAYQSVISDSMLHISYFTLIHGFLNLSFFTMCATVVINLVVGAMDQKGKRDFGDRIDHHCRWAFPFTYFGLIFVMLGVAFLIF